MTRFSGDDVHHMSRALALAARGRGRVEPNPMVGCVLVRAGRVIAEGWHRRFGGPHAEVDALRRATKSPRNATAYVTLEPCCHHGKTPPCTDALIEAGISRVVAAMRDPNTPVRGNGIRRLRAAGLQVDVGLLEKEARQLTRPYLTLLEQGRPYVILKWAQSLDGRIATRTGDSKWISGEPARKRVHRLRSCMDAVVVGMGTVAADDPLLTTRNTPIRRVATRVVLDGRLRMRETYHLVRTAADVPTLIVTSRDALREYPGRVRKLEKLGVELAACRRRGSDIDVASFLRLLGRRQYTNILVEGGGRVLSSFLDAGLVDEAFVFVAPKLIGGATGISPYGGFGVSRIRDGIGRILDVSRVGQDQLYHLSFH